MSKKGDGFCRDYLRGRQSAVDDILNKLNTLELAETAERMKSHVYALVRDLEMVPHSLVVKNHFTERGKS
jgi:hypothetical protein